jgi:DNA-binding transcriptional LysR family regulator
MASAQHLTLQQLLYLEALVEERHVTRAANRMGIGQPTMSTALARMREVFKDPLLVKTSAGMEPTPRALEAVKRIRAIADVLEGRGMEDDTFDPAVSRARFRIMASDGISRVLLPQLVQRAGRHAPGMEFAVSPADARRVAEYLRDGDFDLALTFVRKPPAELRQTMLYPQKLLCIAREGHPAVRGQLTLEQFAAQDHAAWGAPPVPQATIEVMVDEELEKLGGTRHIVLRVSSVTLLPGVVANSDLLAVIPEKLARHALDTHALQLLPLPFDVPSTDVTMLWHDRLHQDPAHQWLRRTLLDIARSLYDPPAVASADQPGVAG